MTEHIKDPGDNLSMDKVDNISVYDENPLWKDLMLAMNCRIDDRIVRLLQLTGYRTYQALKEFTADDVIEIEQFVVSGKIFNYIDEKDIGLYIGSCKSTATFYFLPGEKKLLKSVVAYIVANHSETNKTVGNISKTAMFPIFVKQKKPSQIDNDCDSNAPKKTRHEALVASFDIPSEKLNISKLLKQYFVKNKFPKEYCYAVPSMSISVKTVEGVEGAYLSAKYICPVCKEGEVIQKDKNNLWIMSNAYRHFKRHKTKDKMPVSKGPLAAFLQTEGAQVSPKDTDVAKAAEQREERVPSKDAVVTNAAEQREEPAPPKDADVTNAAEQREEPASPKDADVTNATEQPEKLVSPKGTHVTKTAGQSQAPVSPKDAGAKAAELEAELPEEHPKDDGTRKTSVKDSSPDQDTEGQGTDKVVSSQSQSRSPFAVRQTGDSTSISQGFH